MAGTDGLCGVATGPAGLVSPSPIIGPDVVFTVAACTLARDYSWDGEKTVCWLLQLCIFAVFRVAATLLQLYNLTVGGLLKLCNLTVFSVDAILPFLSLGLLQPSLGLLPCGCSTV